MGQIKRAVKTFLDDKVGVETIDFSCVDEDIKYVSFDIFDTLVKRDVDRPKDVFLLLEKQIGLPGFCKKRITAEKKARSKSQNNEVTLEEIYLCFPGVSPEEVEEYCQRETETELSICRPNRSLISFYQQCVSKKKVILISDMYLDSERLKRILDNCGISGYEKIYVSCEIGASKHDGALYRHVLNDLGIHPNQLLHIGNDYITDLARAKGLGVENIKVKTNEGHLLVGSAVEKYARKSMQFSMIYNFINNTTCSNSKFEDFYYRFGYENYGILLFGFCKWLYDEMEKQGIEQALFIARDGYIIKRVYDAMGLSEIIPSRYLEVSRRSIRVPASFSVAHSFEEAIDLANVTRRVSVGQLLDTWGLDIEDCRGCLEECGIEADAVFWKDSIKNDRVLRQLYERIKDKIITNASTEKNTFEEYVDQFDFSKATALVDIGYGGTIQKELLKGYKRRGILTNIHGYYILFDKSRLNENTDGIQNEIKAFVWTNSKAAKTPIAVNQYVGLFETLFLEQVGSVKRFVKKNNEMKIERYEYEYALATGEIDETASVARIQQGALDFVEAALSTPIGKLRRINERVAFLLLDWALSHPTTEIVERFYNFRFFNMGEASYLAKPKNSVALYSLHPVSLRNEFYESMWKVGFLKKLFGFNVPYMKIKGVYLSLTQRKA